MQPLSDNMRVSASFIGIGEDGLVRDEVSIALDGEAELAACDSNSPSGFRAKPPFDPSPQPYGKLTRAVARREHCMATCK
jgi:hypothetical protein